MDLTEWTKANRNCLDNLDIHLQHWEELYARLQELPPGVATATTLTDSITQHTRLAAQTQRLLEQQRSLLAQFEALCTKCHS